ncbi:tetratricopeptide repeat protein [uncultured Sphingomonas sp.]|uniref:tetratricopeptide repeat protein n=1 Tax=uncultured Sphingomonas sp. TaxID=158754 RepID=UPI0035C97F94
MTLLVPLLLAAATAKAGPVDADVARYQHCLVLTRTDPAAARAEAERWRGAGGSFRAQECAGLANARDAAWPAAAAAFEEAARAAVVAHDRHVAAYWAEAGNAWLAASEPVKARGAIDRAIAVGALTDLPLGEAQLDHARASVAIGDLPTARTDIDHALVNASADPLAWLLSATLARRMGDQPRARKDIAQALKLSSDDAAVQLEAGNLSALAGDEPGARAAWTQAVRLSPDSAAGRSASGALAQFDVPAATAASVGARMPPGMVPAATATPPPVEHR